MSDLDDLLADLAGDSDVEDEGNDSKREDIEVDEEEAAAAARDQVGHGDSTAQLGKDGVARLLHSRDMQDVLRRIDEYSGAEQRRIMGVIEADPEYLLIVKANDISMEVDDEIKRVVEYIKQRYAVKFPDLEKIVLHPLQYARTVKVIGNQEDLVHLKLNEIVPNSLAMSIAVTATTTDGRPLTSEELEQVNRACDVAVDLEAAKNKIIRYVQSRIETIAPNVTKIVGPLTAAKLIGQAGGITGLAKCPSCNVPSLGKKQGIMNGFSKIGSQAQGFLYYCDLVQSVPEDVRKQAQRQISGKVILAARIDAVHESPSGEKGLQFKDELLKKMDKLSEPPDLKDVKALPAPDDPAKSRRGGKKVRKAKEKYAVTELQKLRNRMAFGKEENEVGYGDESEGLGMIGSSSSIRAPTIDKRTRAKLPKARTKGGQLVGTAALLSSRPLDSLGLRHPGVSGLGGTARPGGSATVGGMQSSLSFSSVQGIELPSLTVDALQKKQGDGKWFMGGTYSQIKRP